MFSRGPLERSLQASACQIHTNNQAGFPVSLRTDGAFQHPAGHLPKEVLSGEENSAFFKHRSFSVPLARPPTAFGEVAPTQAWWQRAGRGRGACGELSDCT